MPPTWTVAAHSYACCSSHAQANSHSGMLDKSMNLEGLLRCLLRLSWTRWCLELVARRRPLLVRDRKPFHCMLTGSGSSRSGMTSKPTTLEASLLQPALQLLQDAQGCLQLPAAVFHRWRLCQPSCAVGHTFHSDRCIWPAAGSSRCRKRGTSMSQLAHRRAAVSRRRTWRQGRRGHQQLPWQGLQP